MSVIKASNNDRVKHLLKTLRYALYVIVHPFDGFWDLTHEKRGSIGAANIIVILMLLTTVWEMQFTSFIFMKVQWEYVNIIIVILGVLVPLIIWCIANWSLSTLMDGKGTLKNIYMGTAYALTPFVVIRLPLIFLSNLVTVEEGAFYSYFSFFSVLWCGLLFLVAMMMIHDYSLGKAVFVSIITIVGMGVIVFLLLLFFSLVSDAIAYFISLYKEIAFRFY